MVPGVKGNNPDGTQKTFTLDFEEQYAREGRQEKLQNLISIFYDSREFFAIIYFTVDRIFCRRRQITAYLTSCHHHIQ